LPPGVFVSVHSVLYTALDAGLRAVFQSTRPIDVLQ
jgi:hypothetical protein